MYNTPCLVVIIYSNLMKSHWSLSLSLSLPLDSPSLTGKKSNELIQGSLSSIKFAANSLTRKFDEIKGAISANSTPVKTNNGNPQHPHHQHHHSHHHQHHHHHPHHHHHHLLRAQLNHHGAAAERRIASRRLHRCLAPFCGKTQPTGNWFSLDIPPSPRRGLHTRLSLPLSWPLPAFCLLARIANHSQPQ